MSTLYAGIAVHHAALHELNDTEHNEQTLIGLIDKLPGIPIQSMWLTEDKRPDRNETWLNALIRKP